MKVIGLTGNIGTGKTTASSIIRSLGIKVIDCDDVSREVSKSDDVLKVLENAFGKKIIDSSGKLNRKELGKIVFSSKEKINTLNSIMHPLIKKRTVEYINEFSKTEKLCVVDGAILIEAGFTDILDDIILISSSEKLQLERVSKRDGHTYEYIKGIIDSQMPLEEKKKYCRFIIDNNNSIEDLKIKIEKIIKALLDLEA